MSYETKKISQAAPSAAKAQREAWQKGPHDPIRKIILKEAIGMDVSNASGVWFDFESYCMKVYIPQILLDGILGQLARSWRDYGCEKGVYTFHLLEDVWDDALWTVLFCVPASIKYEVVAVRRYP